MKILTRITIALFAAALLVYAGMRVYYERILDRVPPVIRCASDTLEISVEDPESALLSGVTAQDNRDGDLTGKIQVQGVSQLIGVDTAKVTYVVFDKAHNMGTVSRYVRYTDYQRPRFSLKTPPVVAAGSDAAVHALVSSLNATCLLDGDISDSIRVTTMKLPEGEEGVFELTIQAVNSLGDVQSLRLNLVASRNIPKSPPFALDDYVVYLKAGTPFSPKSCLQRVLGGEELVKVESNVDISTPGQYLVCYTYENEEIHYTAYLTVVVE